MRELELKGKSNFSNKDKYYKLLFQNKEKNFSLCFNDDVCNFFNSYVIFKNPISY